MVCIVAIDVLNGISTRRTNEMRLVVFNLNRGVVFLIINKANEVETTLVCPEVIILIARKHHGCLQAGVSMVKPYVRRLFQDLDAKSLL